MSQPKRSVVLVDDDSEVVWGLGRCLTRAGFAVSTCTDGAEAVELLRSREFDVLVTDVQMPGVNGLALIEWVRENRPRSQVVVMTAFGSPQVKQVSLSKGAGLYLEKPVDPQFLIEIIRSRSSDSFSGRVDQIDLFDYVQLMLLTRRRVLLEVSAQGGEGGLLYLNQGTVAHASCGALEGEPAFYRLLSFRGGAFSTLPWREPERATIERRGDFLLMEAARRKDEGGRGGPAPGGGEDDLPSS